MLLGWSQAGDPEQRLTGIIVGWEQNCGCGSSHQRKHKAGNEGIRLIRRQGAVGSPTETM